MFSSCLNILILSRQLWVGELASGERGRPHDRYIVSKRHLHRPAGRHELVQPGGVTRTQVIPAISHEHPSLSRHRSANALHQPKTLGHRRRLGVLWRWAPQSALPPRHPPLMALMQRGRIKHINIQGAGEMEWSEGRRRHKAALLRQSIIAWDLAAACLEQLQTELGLNHMQPVKAPNLFTSLFFKLYNSTKNTLQHFPPFKDPYKHFASSG